jgi:two-component system cell cycle sensor histidine kinase/response regulator CckA
VDRELRLRQEHAFFFENATDLFCVLDTDGRFVDVNPAWERLFGFTAAELRGQRVGDYLHPHDPAPELGELYLAPDPSTISAFDVRCRARSGTYRWLRWKSVVDREHNLRYAVARDITGTTAHEGDAEARQRALSSERIDSIAILAGGISHHFNNLLCVTLGYVHMLLDELPQADALHGYAAEIKGATEKAVDFVHKLRMFSQRQEADSSALDLNQVLRGIESLLRHLVTEEVTVNFELDASVGPVLASRSLIEQAIVNLVLNARDAMPRGGTLTVRTGTAPGAGRGAQRVAPQVALSIIDTGTGIPPQAADHLFEPFFTTKDIGAGNGLGLATVYGIARQCGGHVSVHSTPGQGSTFTLYLPEVARAVAHAGAAAAIAPERVPAPGRGGETVLVVEDDEKVRGLVYQSLKRQGYQVLMAASGDKVLRLLEHHPGPVHLLLTDVLLPGQNGAEIARELKARRPELRVMFMSGYPDEHLPLDSEEELGPFLAKPFTPAQLVQRVREVLDRPVEGAATHADAAARLHQAGR